MLVVAHGNSLRALRKHIDGKRRGDRRPRDPTGFPFLYEFDGSLGVVSKGYLGDPDAAQVAAEAVRRQTG